MGDEANPDCDVGKKQRNSKERVAPLARRTLVNKPASCEKEKKDELHRSPLGKCVETAGDSSAKERKIRDYRRGIDERVGAAGPRRKGEEGFGRRGSDQGLLP